MNDADQLCRLPYDARLHGSLRAQIPKCVTFYRQSDVLDGTVLLQTARVELMHMIRKGQMHDDGRGLSAAQQFYLLAE
jgi:hypothetical protein